jgi:isoleucyl-tRNA synthetase
VPFLADEIYRNLVCSVDKKAPISVHLCDFPVPDGAAIDAALEKNMDEVLKIVALGRAGRNAANVKNRQPLSTLWVCGGEKLPPEYVALVEDELNVKNVEYTDSAERFAVYLFKPQLRTCGKKFGKLVPALTEALKAIDGAKAMAELEATGQLKVNAGGETLTLEKEDLIIETQRCEGFVAQSDGGVTAVLNTNLTPELIEEGFVRELTNKFQTMRKEAGFEVTDRIVAGYKTGETLRGIIERNGAQISADILANSISADMYDGYEKEWDINGESAVLYVKKAK